jgi:hypothetical protein
MAFAAIHCGKTDFAACEAWRTPFGNSNSLDT